MRIPPSLKIAVLAVGATLFYTYVGQMVPQKEVHPPEVIELPTDLSPEELAEVGRTIFEGKGICSTCHTIGQSGALRFPDMGGIGSRAGTRIPGMDGLEYLTQSLYEPDSYIVEGFTAGMPAINRPPIGLTDQEILAVVAYLQTLGGTLTVSLDTQLPVPGREAPASTETEVAAAPAAATASDDPLTKYDCASCHRLDAPGELEAVSLQDVGTRMNRNGILAAMLSSHRDTAFFQQATIGELEEIVEILAAKGGN